MAEGKKIGVVLFQLGGPDSLEAVEPFLYNLFVDPDIIDFPLARLARKPLARRIARSRAQKVQKLYAAIGGKSPIVEWTRRQSRALEEALRKSIDARVVVAMRYWHPLTDDALRELAQEKNEDKNEDVWSELILLPLYPQYSKTTTGSSFNEWGRQFAASAIRNVPVRRIQDFHRDPGYIDAVVEKINSSLEKFAGSSAPPDGLHLVFSAHGLPISVIKAGDPYQEQVEATVRLLLERGRWPFPHTICYQSRVGAGRWLGPTLHAVIAQLGAQGVQNALVVPVSFVSDHIETLHEIDIEAREEALQAGFRQFEMMPGLNDSPKFIQAMADLVLKTVGAEVPR